MDRLAPDREGPLAAGHRYTAPDRGPSARRSATSSSPTPELLTTGSRTPSYHADQLGNGAKELLDEVATGKVTARRSWSHTDLWDFQANVNGARVA